MPRCRRVRVGEDAPAGGLVAAPASGSRSLSVVLAVVPWWEIESALVQLGYCV